MIVRLSEADQFHDFDWRGGMVRAANGVGRLDEAFGWGPVSRQSGRTQSRVHGVTPGPRRGTQASAPGLGCSARSARGGGVRSAPENRNPHSAHSASGHVLITSRQAHIFTRRALPCHGIADATKWIAVADFLHDGAQFDRALCRR